MKILHIASLPATKANGINIVVEKLSTLQHKIGNEVIVWRVSKEGDKRYKCVSNFKNIGQEIKEVNPDIVIFHSIYYIDYIRVSRYLRSHNIPYLIQLHGALSRQNYRKGYIRKLIANTLFFKKFISGAQSIIYLNDQELNESVVPRWNKNHLIIPNGCEIKPPISIKVNDKKAIQFLFIGRINIHHKGLDLLINAFRRLYNQKDTPPVSLDIYGIGHEEDMNRLKELLSGLDEIVRYRGAIYGDEKIDALHNADIFVHTSRYEGMPMAVLEALGCGLPCLLTPGTNMAEEVASAQGGWRVEPSAEKIAEKIAEISQSLYPGMEIMKRNALELANKYSWANIAELSIKKYNDALQTRK